MRILVTGGTGLLGYALQRVAATSNHEFRFLGSSDGNLQCPGTAERLICGYRPDCIVHAAAVVGGVRWNLDRPEEMLDRNRAINRNVLEAALRHGVPKVISFLSTCIFPPDAPEPWDETLIHRGEPDQRHWGYAQAKQLLDQSSRELTERSGGRSRFVTLMPTTMYGPNDNFHPERSHVLPALVLRFFLAGQHGEDVVLWGTGEPRREFLFSFDMARAVLWAVENHDDPETVIVSPSTDVSIRELAQQVAELCDFQGQILWDHTKPDGTPSRKTSNAKLRRLLPGFEFTPLAEGLQTTLRHFRENYPYLRGVGDASSCVAAVGEAR